MGPIYRFPVSKNDPVRAWLKHTQRKEEDRSKRKEYTSRVERNFLPLRFRIKRRFRKSAQKKLFFYFYSVFLTFSINDHVAEQAREFLGRNSFATNPSTTR